MNFILICFILLFSCNQTGNKNNSENNCYNAKKLEYSQNTNRDVICGQYIFSLKSKEFKKEDELIKTYQYDLIYYENNNTNILFLINNIDKKVNVLDICNGKELLSMNINYIEFKGVYKIEP